MGLKVTNNAFGTLNAGITSSSTTIVLNAGEGARFPTLSAGDYFYATLIDTTNNLEIVKVTARSTDTMTVVRAQDNTTARAFSTNDRFELRPTAALFNEKANANEYLPLTGGTLTGKLAVGSGVTPVTALHAQSSSSEADRSLRLAYDGTYYSEIRQLGAGGMAFRNNNTTNLMAIDGSGRVTKALQPAFYAQWTGANTRINTPGTVFNFDSEVYDVGSHYSTGTFTAPVAGKYVFNCGGLTYAGNSTYLWVEKNGGAYPSAYFYHGGVSDYQHVGLTVVMDMAASDTARIYVQYGNLNSGYWFFCGYLLG
jgi:hypothetical protein